MARDGVEAFRKWYRLGWGEDGGFIVDGAAEALEAAVETQLENVAKRLEKD